jgi:hypothetical protein
MEFTRDNYYKECPAVMAYSQLTDYRQAATREEYIRSINNVVSEHDYRYFLQNNAAKIMDAEWTLLTKTYNCQPNACIHNSSTRQPEGDQYKELRLYNDTRSGKVKPEEVQCKKFSDYRMC